MSNEIDITEPLTLVSILFNFENILLSLATEVINDNRFDVLINLKLNKEKMIIESKTELSYNFGEHTEEFDQAFHLMEESNFRGFLLFKENVNDSKNKIDKYLRFIFNLHFINSADRYVEYK